MPTNTLYTVSGTIIAHNITRDDAIKIYQFARRPVIWGHEKIGVTNHVIDPGGVPYGN
jgi:23S rRNA maturation-related 3'-5' exoribonuclease YhaM